MIIIIVTTSSRPPFYCSSAGPFPDLRTIPCLHCPSNQTCKGRPSPHMSLLSKIHFGKAAHFVSKPIFETDNFLRAFFKLSTLIYTLHPLDTSSAKSLFPTTLGMGLSCSLVSHPPIATSGLSPSQTQTQ